MVTFISTILANMPNGAETSSLSGNTGGLQVPTKRWFDAVCLVVNLWFKQTVVVLVWPVKVQPGFLETGGLLLESSLKYPSLPRLSADTKSTVSLSFVALPALESVLLRFLLPWHRSSPWHTLYTEEKISKNYWYLPKSRRNSETGVERLPPPLVALQGPLSKRLCAVPGWGTSSQSLDLLNLSAKPELVLHQF